MLLKDRFIMSAIKKNSPGALIVGTSVWKEHKIFATWKNRNWGKACCQSKRSEGHMKHMKHL